MMPTSATTMTGAPTPPVPSQPLYLTTTELRDAVGHLDGYRLSPRTLSDWTRSSVRVLTPSVRRRGKLGGVSSLWSVGDLARVRLLLRLRRQLGVGRAMSEHLLEFFYERFDTLTPVDAARCTLECVDGGWRWYRRDSTATREGGWRMSIPLLDVVAGNEAFVRTVRQRHADTPDAA